MKKELHPTYYQDTTVVCACGNTFTTGSVLKEIRVDICSACHPFYTGQRKFIDTEGRVERFQRKMETGTRKKKKKQSKAQSFDQSQKTLKEMLQPEKGKSANN